MWYFVFRHQETDEIILNTYMKMSYQIWSLMIKCSSWVII